MTTAKNLVREAGYEALFFSGLFLGLALTRGQRNYERVFDWYCECRMDRRQMRRLEERGVIATRQAGRSGRSGCWVPGLTALGRAAFSGGRDPEAAWKREWDGRWRILTFDLPRKENRTRMKLARWLRSNHFGHIQGSVWILPDPLPEVRDIIGKERIHPKTMTVIEGTLAGTKSPREIAAVGWDFHSINAAYGSYIEFTARFRRKLSCQPPLEDLRAILRNERNCWLKAVQVDPLLPESVIPKGYLGVKAWRERQKFLAKLHDHFRRRAES